MVVNKRKKSTKLRGSQSHGWGRHHRGKGSKGGAGNAGTGKKAHVKKFERVKIKYYFGKRGFIKKGQVKPVHTIDLRTLFQKLRVWTAQGKISGTTIDLTKLGYDKLLSTGQAKKPVTITIEKATAKAVEKIEKAGGAVHQKEGSHDKLD
jgi:large subunit ribosomal protein L15